MLKKDNFGTGGFIGLVFPTLAFVLEELLRIDFRFQKKEHLLYIAAILINLLMLRYFYGRGLEKTSRGIILSTIISLLFVYFYKKNL